MNLTEFKDEVHKNAVDHGWWESDRSIAECLALVHSEWSEALEEDRAGHPDVWYACNEGCKPIICHPKDETDCTAYGKENECRYHSKKPEGVCIELVDGCIRLLDLIGYIGDSRSFDIDLEYIMCLTEPQTFQCSLPVFVARLHASTAWLMDPYGEDNRELEIRSIYALIARVCCFIEARGYDPEELLRVKHNYNLTRPYKHGKAY